jgi:hypothetical protein
VLCLGARMRFDRCLVDCSHACLVQDCASRNQDAVYLLPVLGTGVDHDARGVHALLPNQVGLRIHPALGGERVAVVFAPGSMAHNRQSRIGAALQAQSDVIEAA